MTEDNQTLAFVAFLLAAIALFVAIFHTHTEISDLEDQINQIEEQTRTCTIKPYCQITGTSHGDFIDKYYDLLTYQDKTFCAVKWGDFFPKGPNGESIDAPRPQKEIIVTVEIENKTVCRGV